MGTLINFISQHIHIPLSPAQKDHDHDYHHQQQQRQCDQPRYYSIFSDLSAADEQRERALRQFPCEEKHSFNPHYQHNLISTSPSFSSPPSLSSSPSSSSPSSAYSGSSSSSLSRATGAKVFSQDSYAQQQNPSFNATSNSNSNSNNYSYHRHYSRRQNLRFYTYQQQQDHYHDDWMFGITEDDDNYRTGLNRSQTIGPSTTRAISQECSVSPSPSSSTVSLKSSISRKNRSQLGHVMNAFPATLRSTVTFSPVVLQHPARNEPQQQQLTSSSSVSLLPSISESSLSSQASNSSPVTATFDYTASSSSSSSEQQQQHQQQEHEQSGTGGRLTAKQSLMRIAHCSKSEDGWCSQKAGQYTKRYADVNPRGMR
ncbi:hypothetical protein BGZ54_002089, partial [Gamsiella multidivaricata]